MEKVITKVEREPGEKNFSCYMRVKSVKTDVLGQGSSARAAILTSSLRTPKVFVKEFSYFLMPCH